MATDDARPTYDDLAAVVKAIANEELFTLLEGSGDAEQRCVVCGGIADIAWDYDDEGNRFADTEFCSVAHREDCPIGRAQALAAQLPPG
jgi:hypothetical protein